MLIEFSGSLILVSHDREFIDNTVTSTLVFDSPGEVNEYVGGYEDWLRQRPQPEQTSKMAEREKKPVSKPAAPVRQSRELKSLPTKIEKLETKIAGIHAQFAESGFYQQNEETIRKAQHELQSAEQQLEQLYLRWEELESGG